MRRCDIDFTVYGTTVKEIESHVEQVLDELLGDTVKDWTVDIAIKAETITYNGKSSIVSLSARVEACKRGDDG